LNKTEIGNFLEEYFRSLPETAYSKQLQQLVYGFLETTATYTEFFSAMLNHFFKEEGLLFIDAAHPEMRKYESGYFQQLILHASEISEEVCAAEQELTAMGYKAPLSAEAD